MRLIGRVSWLFLPLINLGAATGQQSLPDPGSADYGGFRAKVKLPGLDNWQQAIAYSPDGTLFASQSVDHITSIVDTKTGVTSVTIPNTVGGVAFSPDSSLLAVRSLAQNVQLYNSHTGKFLKALPITGPFAFAPKGSTIAGVTGINTITLFDPKTGFQRFSFKDNCATVFSIAFSPDGFNIATANIDTLVRVFDVTTGGQKKILQGNSDQVLQVAYSPDGGSLASDGKDGTIWIWNSISGVPTAVLRDKRGFKSFAFSPDGSTIATGGWDYLVKLWNVSNGRLITTLTPPKATVMALAFSPESSSLAVGQWGVSLWAGAQAKNLPPDTGRPIDDGVPGGQALDFYAPGDPSAQALPVKPGRDYFLIGSRHIYWIGPDPTLHMAERKEIEETYMEAVAADQAAYQARVDFGANPTQQANNRDADIVNLPTERDQAIASLYPQRDDLRDAYPQLKSIDVDGPYQVVGVDSKSSNDNGPVYDDFVAYDPWPEYSFSGPPFGGWIYGAVYPTTVFFETYANWRKGYHGRWYYAGLFGHRGRILVVNGRVVGRFSDYRARSAYGRPSFPNRVAATAHFASSSRVRMSAAATHRNYASAQVQRSAPQRSTAAAQRRRRG